MPFSLGVNNLSLGFKATVNVAEKRTLRALSYQMLPQFVFEAYPNFVEFVETFLDFAEKRYSPDGLPNPGPYHILKNLFLSSDLDETEEEFVQILKLKLGRDLPAVTQHNLRLFLKRIRDFYRSKGTEDSIKFFFRSVFNTYSRIYLPKVDLLRPSSSTWYVPYRMKPRVIGGGDLTDYQLSVIFDASVVGQESGTTAWLGTHESGWIEILASSGEFIEGETITATLTDGTTWDIWIPAGNLEYGEGSFLTDDGMPSSNKRIQDSFYWQEFSYEIISTNQIVDIVNPLVMNVHPAGFKIFARVEDENPSINDPDDGGEIGLIRYLDLIICRIDTTGSDDITSISLPTEYSFLRIHQAFTDYGELLDGLGVVSFAEVFTDTLTFESFKMPVLETMEPAYNLITSYDGFKMVNGTIFQETSLNRDKDARVISAKDQTAALGIGGFSLETLADSVISNLDSAQVRVLPRQTRVSEVLSPSRTQIIAGSFQLTGTNLVGDNEWSAHLQTGKKVLGFKNGVLISPNALTIGYSYIDSPEPYMTFTFGPGETDVNDLENPPIYEFVYLEESDLFAGTHSLTDVLNEGETELVFSSLSTATQTDALVFRDGRILTPGRDFNIYPDLNAIRFTEPGTSSEYGGGGVHSWNEITIVLMKDREKSVSSVPVTISTESEIVLPSPIDAPLEILPGSLETNLSSPLGMWKLSLDSRDPDTEMLRNYAGTGIGDIYCGSPVGTWNNFKWGPDYLNKLLHFTYVSDYIEMSDLDLSQFVQNAGDPFSVNIWLKFIEISGEQYIFCFGSSDVSASSLNTIAQLKVMKVGLDFKLRATASNGVSLVTLDSNLGDVWPDEWFMATVRYDGTDLKLTIQTTEASRVDYSVALTSSVTGASGSAIESLLGIDTDLYDESKLYGQLGYLGIWNAYLTDHDVNALFNNGVPITEPTSSI